MMRYKFYVFLFLLSTLLFKAQILDEYPKKQDFYEGGLAGFYKEAHDYLVKSNAKECDKNQIYQPRIIVTKEKVIKLIQDSDPENISKNKCAYDLSMEIIKNLEKWKPAEVKGMQFGAITEFIIYPPDLMADYKPEYDGQSFIKYAKYPTGFKEFQREFNANFRTLFRDYQIQGVINLEFYINQKGKISNIRIYPPVDNKAFNVDVMRTMRRLDKTWMPAIYSNIPIKQRIAFPVQFTTSFTEHRTGDEN